MMTEVHYNGSLEGLFALLEQACVSGVLPDRVRRDAPIPGLFLSGAPPAVPEQPDLFGGGNGSDAAPGKASPIVTSGVHSEPSCSGIAGTFFEISAAAYDAFVHAWMSEFTIEAELIRYARNVITAAGIAPSGTAASRQAAETAAADRGESAARAVLDAAYKTGHEIHRLLGFLRFNPCRNEGGSVYIARCAPDHCVLPALGEHFSRRFGEKAWAIIDEKRDLCLTSLSGQEPELIPAASFCLPSRTVGDSDPWEDLWRNYHRSINNESRKNPALQRQFMPLRYWKYLPEVRQ